MHQVYITSLLPFTSGVYGTFVITEQILKADREASTTSIITDHAELYSRIVRYIGVICSCCFIRSEFNYVVGDLRDITTVFLCNICWRLVSFCISMMMSLFLCNTPHHWILELT